MQYYFNNIDPTAFQQLINAILVSRFGEDLRLTPLRGADGGRDGETAPFNPYIEYQVSETAAFPSLFNQPRMGRYLFQVKHHNTSEIRPADARRKVLSDFERELRDNVLPRTGDEKVNFFILITNVASSHESIEAVDAARRRYLHDVSNLHADIWWGERVIAFLDLLPSLWHSYPLLFAGGKVPFLGQVSSGSDETLARAVRVAVQSQYRRDMDVRFRQIQLENSIEKLFIDLDLDVRSLAHDEQSYLQYITRSQQSKVSMIARPLRIRRPESTIDDDDEFAPEIVADEHTFVSAMKVTLSESMQEPIDDEYERLLGKILLQGGPGQGKSTLVQTAVQVYRYHLLERSYPQVLASLPSLDPQGRWVAPSRIRLPFRVELRIFAEWLASHEDSSVEEYLAEQFKRDSGGCSIDVRDIHSMVESSPVFLVFDGLDEVASDEMRSTILGKLTDCIDRFESNLQCDLKVVITSRPPAVAGHLDSLADFTRLPLAPLSNTRIDKYISRWAMAQLHDQADIEYITTAFNRRRTEPHVQALSKNPMQLSILLNFIQMLGEAFPDRRAELYRDYFDVVIKRDIEKSAEFRLQRDKIVALHEYLGYQVHALTEAEQADGSIVRKDLLRLVETWLRARGNDPNEAGKLFELGEERLGLIFALKGEGDQTAYGFEVQPVREYFAAAFIQHQIEGNANAVFEELLRRPYWREVALFLAGLCRPNEKADLISRARQIDRDPKWGWRQDGRSAIFDLLQEGVFSDPPNVFIDGLDFVLELLDSHLVPAQLAPDGFVEAVRKLLIQVGQIESGHGQNQIDRLFALARQYRDEHNSSRLWQVLRVLSSVATSASMRELLISVTGGATAIVNARVVWPAYLQLDMRDAAFGTQYWEGAHPEIWAEALWSSGLRSPECRKLPIPSDVHLPLLHQFVANPITVVDKHIGRPTLLPNSSLAVWLLAAASSMLSRPSTFTTANTSIDQAVEDLQALTRQADYNGLAYTLTHTN